MAPVIPKFLAVLALPLILGACSSAPDSSPAPPVSPSSTAPSGPGPYAGLLTGSQLKVALASSSFFPPGFMVDPTGTRDTGTTYNPPSANVPAKYDCTMLEDTSWTLITGISGVSFAQTDYVSQKPSAEIAQEIDVYPGTTSWQVMTALSQVAAECPAYPEPNEKTLVTVTEQPLPGVGGDAYLISVTDPDGPHATLIAARSGTAVVTVLANNGKDGGRSTALSLAKLIVDAIQGKA